MTEKEKKALKDAFGIPEPDRKEEFAEQFRQRMNQRPKRRVPPIVMRISATAAMLAVIIGIYAAMPSSPSELDTSDKIANTTTISANVDMEKNEDTTATTTLPSVTTVTLSNSANAVKDINVETVTETTAAKNISATTAAAQSGRKTVVTTTASRTARATSRTSAITTRTNSSHKTSTVTKRTTTTQKATATTPINTTAPASYTKSVLTTAPAPSVTPYYRDLTITPDVIYDINENIVNARDLIPESEQTDAPIVPGGKDNAPVDPNSPIDQKIAEMLNNSYTVVLAKIDKIVYTSINGMPYTAENITIQDVYKGSFNSDDRLTVYITGGYMPADEYMKTHPEAYLSNPNGITVFDDGGCNGEQEEGQTYLFFISNNDTRIPYGAYSLSADGDQAVFKKKRSTFVSISDESLSFPEYLLG